MQIGIRYGKVDLTLDLQDDANIHVVRSQPAAPVHDAETAIRRALKTPIGLPPLAELVRAHDRVVLVFSDITRPVPNDILIPNILREIGHVPKDRIVLLNALGTHRPQTPEELSLMLGQDIVRDYRIVQHDANDQASLVQMGQSSCGSPFWLNRQYAEADKRIVTGLIEPHFFAGFSGGPKAIVPGIAGLETILANHSPHMLASPGATWACTEGNPVWMEMHELAVKAGPAFLVNICITSDRRIAGVFAGDLTEAHAAGCEYANTHAVRHVASPADIVVTSNAGYPLDQNLYQAVKAMSVAARVVRPGGHIIVAAECRDGVPDGSHYQRMLRQARSPEEAEARLLASGTVEPEQWQVQVQLAIQRHATVHLKSDGLSDDEIRAALLEPCHQVEETIEDLRRRLGPEARICILPDGPHTIATLVGPRHPKPASGRAEP